MLGGLLGDVDTVEELTFILGADRAALGNLRAHERHGSVVDTLKDKLVLHISGKADGDTVNHVDLLEVRTTQEVLKFNGLASSLDLGIDGEMSMYESHLVDVVLKGTLLFIKLREE